MLFYDLYILTLVNKLIFIYARPHGNCSSQTIKTEFAALYSAYPEINDITMKIHAIKARDIDGLVLHYMHKFGIDNVRGGSYTQIVFSNDLKMFIGDRIQYIYQDLENTHKLLSLVHSNNIKKVLDLRKQITELTPCLTKTEFNALCELQPNAPASELYNNLVEKCSRLYYQFCKTCPDGKNDLQKLLGFQSHIWLYSPHVAFDDYFISGSDKEIADKILNCFDFMITYMQNRIDELEFDIMMLQEKKDLTGSATLA